MEMDVPENRTYKKEIPSYIIHKTRDTKKL